MMQLLRHVAFAGRRWLHRGGSFYCPVCGNAVQRFLPLSKSILADYERYGWTGRLKCFETLNVDGYYCPVCYSSDRERLYAEYFNSVFKGLRQGRKKFCIDFAPSRFFICYMKNFEFISYHAVDKFMNSVDERVDIEYLPYKNESVDIFICSHILEHVNNDRFAMEELHRVLTRDGFGVIMVPILLSQHVIDEDHTVTNVTERWRRFGQGDHVRLYSKEGFMERLKGAGFEVCQLGVDYFTSKRFHSIGVNVKSVLYVVRKCTVS